MTQCGPWPPAVINHLTLHGSHRRWMVRKYLDSSKDYQKLQKWKHCLLHGRLFLKKFFSLQTFKVNWLIRISHPFPRKYNIKSKNERKYRKQNERNKNKGIYYTRVTLKLWTPPRRFGYWAKRKILLSQVKKEDWTGTKREKIGQLCPSTETGAVQGWAMVDNWCQLCQFNQSINDGIIT